MKLFTCFDLSDLVALQCFMSNPGSSLKAISYGDATNHRYNLACDLTPAYRCMRGAASNNNENEN
jgi:hypothetical protein